MRDSFYSLKQTPQENATAYFSRIMDVYKQCEFPENSAYLIVDRLIHGCHNESCKRKLMGKTKDATVKDCLEILRKFEAVDVTLKKLSTDDGEATVDAMTRGDPTKRSQRNGFRGTTPKKRQEKTGGGGGDKVGRSCSWCGSSSRHSKENCPAKDSACNFCEKRGHFEKACFIKKKFLRDKQADMVEYSQGEEDESYDIDELYTIDEVEECNEIIAPLTLCLGDKQIKCKAKVDTGAMITCKWIQELESMGIYERDLEPSKAIIRGAAGTDLQNCGIAHLNVICNGITKVVKIYATKKKINFILGLQFCLDFKLIEFSAACVKSPPDKSRKVDAVMFTSEADVDYEELTKKWSGHLPLGSKSGDAFTDLKNIFPTAFDGGIGQFQGEAHLHLDPAAKPIQMPPRNVPQSIMPALKEEIERLKDQKVLRDCPELTDWVSNLVIQVKKDGSLRLCIDPRFLNRYLIRNVYYTASFEDVRPTLSGAKYYSSLDIKSAYFHKKLDHESQLLTAFNTPWGKVCYTVVPNGLSVSNEYVQPEIDRSVSGVPGTFPAADDIKTQGSTEIRHDVNLLETVQRCSKAGIKFNPKKCQIKRREIEFFGRLISPEGIRPHPDKIAAIQKISAPLNKQELQSIMGTINFLASFIPNLADKTPLMRGLMKKDVHFQWTSDVQDELEKLKKTIITATINIHYDPHKPLTIEVDASMKGLGAVLLQDDLPVRFFSKALTETESNYANIEREMLAIVFACEKAHNYVFGRDVTIHTDHKPLQSIFNKAISQAPARLQRMLLRVSQYNLTVKYVGANKVLVADTLSRLIDTKQPKEIPGLDVTIAQVLKIEPTRLEYLQDATKSDNELTDLSKLITEGWPDSLQDVPEHLRPYWSFRDELTIMNGLVLKGNRVVIPRSDRHNTLARLHDSHHQETKLLQRARRSIYWPNMDDDVRATCFECEKCQVHGPKLKRPPERQLSAARPMELLGMDLSEETRLEAFIASIQATCFLNNCAAKMLPL